MISIKYLFLLFSLLLFCCFPNKKVTLQEQSEISAKNKIDAPTKVFLLDASVILYKNGFKIKDDNLIGVGVRHRLDGKILKLNSLNVPVDSVAALIYYETESTGGSGFASFLLGLYGGFLTPLSIYCLSCPKCCFGSCPTVYTYNGKNYELEAELFSYSISRYFQESELDKLSTPKNSKQEYRIRISNEALETHYIDQFSLLDINHPFGTQIFPTYDGDIICTGDLKQPSNVTNFIGEDITHLVNRRDNNIYRSGEEMVKKISDGFTSDIVDLKLDLPNDTKEVNLVFKLRNTLLTTILFYELVLSSQGFEAIEWTEKMQNNYIYAKLFNELYKSYAGIRIKTFKDGSWKSQSKIGDIGPIAWKEIAVTIPVEVENKTASIRLEFFPDNFMIDYIGYDYRSKLNDDYQINSLKPQSIVDDENKSRHELIEILGKPDENFLITNPGESYYLSYNLKYSDSTNTSVLVQSKGYYTEWIRGNWLVNCTDDYKFNMFEVEKTLLQLQNSWLENRPIIEDKFFETRIPLKEDLQW
jgi:hypothetical protein